MARRQPIEPEDAELAVEHVGELTREEGQALFDARARAALGISGEEFLRRWDAGEYANVDRSEVIRVALLIPFARA